jgi:radical SAM family uncharacterized protein/radical SAM-linked protein
MTPSRKNDGLGNEGVTLTGRLEGLLEKVEKPGRYIGGEWNAIHKDPAGVEVRIALVFPDVYEIGMSYLGQKILYDILNRHPILAAERVFAPWPDLEEGLRSNRLPLFSLESRLPLSRFDILGFSLLYELNYSNILTVLDLGGVPLLSAERGEGAPLVLAGGPAAFNPEPVSDIFDAFLIGDGEDAFVEIAEKYSALKKDGATRDQILNGLAEIPGVYVPSLYESFVPAGSALLARRPKAGAPARISKRIKTRLGKPFYPEAIVVPDIQAVFDRVTIEVARGCPQRCRFCQATSIYFPFRVMDPAVVRKKVRRSLAATGFEDVSLSALSIGDYPFLEATVTALMEELAGQKVSLSLSSLRPKGLSASVAENILKVRKTGFTLVPEAGTDRLRRVINKELDNGDILEAAATAFGRGWRLLKLYFMVGLPTERDEDLEGMARLVEEILDLGKSVMKSPPRINLSLSSFIPKPHTPFQWLSMESEQTLGEKQRLIRSRLSRFRSVAIKAHPTGISVLEAAFSRGDRKLASVLVQAWKRGARFDSWKDRFDFANWEKAFSAEKIDYRIYLGSLDREAPLPWDHIHTGINKNFLLAELEKAIREQRTASCLDSDCRQCRGCRSSLRPQRIFPPVSQARSAKPDIFGRPADRVLRYEAFYEKAGSARFLSHRDLTNHLQRALRRAGLEVAHSAGFHPKMLVSYAPALPLGMEAKEECFEFKSSYQFDERALLRRLNRSTRSGIRFLRVRRVGDSEASLNERIGSMLYSLSLRDSEVQAALKARRELLKTPPGSDIDFIRNETARFVESYPGSRAVFKVDEGALKLWLEIPLLSGRGFRAQDIVASIFGLKNASARLTRERLVFRQDGDRTPPV